MKHRPITGSKCSEILKLGIKKQQHGMGFTLLELLAVIAIIAILGALGTSGYSAAKRQAKKGHAQADLEVIRNALEDFRVAYGYYPEMDPAGVLLHLPANQLANLTNAVATLSLTDPWEQPYWYARSSADRFVYQLWSTGEEVDNEGDDIK